LAFELKEAGYRLKDILQLVNLPESTYHHHVKQMDAENIKVKIDEIFHENGGKYGYRRVHDELRNQGYVINHKKVQRILTEMGLKCEKFQRKSRRYQAYKGPVGKVAKNLLNRRFDTNIPLQKLVTDVTEFKCLEERKLYLSPILDLYNSEIISFSISDRPTLNFVMEPLSKAIETIKNNVQYRTTIHSDQGWHYQHNQWVKALKKKNISKHV